MDHLLAMKGGDVPSEDQTAAERTIGVTELLEEILLALPGKPTLIFKRVSKIWHATITISPKLQQALWFAPKQLKPDPDREVRVNDLLTDRMVGRILKAVTGDEEGQHMRIAINWRTAARACDRQDTFKGCCYGSLWMRRIGCLAAYNRLEV